MSIYVDDVLLLGVDPSVVKNIREQLMNKFSMTNLGSASLVLGMEIEQGDGYIKVSQGNYVNSILRKLTFMTQTLHLHLASGSRFRATRTGPSILTRAAPKGIRRL